MCITTEEFSDNLTTVDLDGVWIGTVVKPFGGYGYIPMDNQAHSIYSQGCSKDHAVSLIVQHYYNVLEGTDQDRAGKNHMKAKG